MLTQQTHDGQKKALGLPALLLGVKVMQFVDARPTGFNYGVSSASRKLGTKACLQ